MLEKSKILCVLFTVTIFITNSLQLRLQVINYISPVRLENLFSLELDLLVLSEYVYRNQAHDSTENHQFLKFLNRTVAIVKEIHNKEEVHEYTSHPINVYHLTRRMRKTWTRIVNFFSNNAYCKQAMHSHLESLKQDIPDKEFLYQIAYDIIKLVTIFNISIDDVVRGDVANKSSVQKLTVEEVYEIGQAAYDKEDYYNSIVWLNKSVAIFETDNNLETIGNLSKSTVKYLLATSHFKIGRPRNAIRILEEILLESPGNQKVKSKQMYYKSTIDSNPSLEDKEFPVKFNTSDYCSMQQSLCSHVKEKGFVQITKKSGLRCFLASATKKVTWFVFPVEVLSRRPLILMIHNATNGTFSDFHEKNSHVQMLRESYEDYTDERLILEDISIISHISVGHSQTIERHCRIQRPYSMSKVRVRNFGLMGSCSSPVKNLNSLNKEGRVATFLLMLSSSQYGGNVAFPKVGVVAPVKKNTLLVWHPTRVQAVVCPSLRGSPWYMWQSLYERKGNYSRPSDKKRLPRFYQRS